MKLTTMQMLAHVLALLVMTAITGFALSMLWLWIVVPTFNAPVITCMQSIGIIVIINFITVGRPPAVSTDNYWRQFISNIVIDIVTVVYALVTGYLISLFL
jgi:hypothetical protein